MTEERDDGMKVGSAHESDKEFPGGVGETGRLDARDRRIEQLEALLYDIAIMADGHKASTLYVRDENVALVNIRNMAGFAIGLEDTLRERGTLFAAGWRVVEVQA
jgi:hypothetical protein|nr:hypothetical protein [Neorhizobium tomejilense]